MFDMTTRTKVPVVYTDFRRETPERGLDGMSRFLPEKFVLRINGDADRIMEAAKSQLVTANPGIGFERIALLDELTSRAIGGTGSNKLITVVSIAFGILALLLAAVGIYGVMWNSVSRRTYEIGVRMAMGATRANVMTMVLRKAVRLTVLGLMLGLTGAWAATRLLSGMLFGVSATDPVTFTAVTVFLLLVAIAASLIPARRAASVDPLVATRAE
jgi:ABC-type antimicrobial peptide transport system permease subunit